MTRRITVTSLRHRIIRTIVDVCRAKTETDRTEGESTTLETSVAQLIRETMREMASDEEADTDLPRWHRKGSLLREATETVQGEVGAALRANQVDADLEEVFSLAEKNLKPTGEELQRLSDELTKSRREKRVKPRMLEPSQVDQPYSIHQIGLEGSPTGLLARPTGDGSLTLDLDALRQIRACEISGDRFPIELLIDDHVFVVDDDGSVFVSVDGLPEKDRDRIEFEMREIVRALYS